MRQDGRAEDQLREVIIHPNYLKNAHGSVLIEVGDTKVLCAATVEGKVPPFRRDSGKGWVTAEYSMLPCSTNTRNSRESMRGRIGGRTHEIQRLIGRSLRSVIDMKKIDEKTITVDCDVIQADGGTRTAAVTGGYLAIALAVEAMKKSGVISRNEVILTDYLAAISVGILKGTPCLDLNYQEDSSADVDANIVMTGSGKFVEVQGTAEGEPFSLDEMRRLIGLASRGIDQLIKIQKKILYQTINV